MIGAKVDLEKAKKQGLCFNCGRKGHQARQCRQAKKETKPKESPPNGTTGKYTQVSYNRPKVNQRQCDGRTKRASREAASGLGNRLEGELAIAQFPNNITNLCHKGA